MSLPDKPSELVQIALNDFRKAKATKGYIIEMNEWHTGDDYDKTCLVCLAGSVMAFSLNCHQFTSRRCTDYEADTTSKLRFIDSIRLGFLCDFGYEYSIREIGESNTMDIQDDCQDLFNKHNKNSPSDLGESEFGKPFEIYLEEVIDLLKEYGV